MHFVAILRIRPTPDEMARITERGFDRVQIGELISRGDEREAGVNIP